jgi:curli production assembly/transport component CsgF
MKSMFVLKTFTRRPLTVRHVAVAGLAGLLIQLPAFATDLVYTPTNPAFGGSPLNGSHLLATAQAQNPFRATTANTPLQNFNNSLQQAILTRLSTATLTTMFGTGSKLLPGTYDTEAYTITVVDRAGVLTISTTDKKTGAAVSFEVSSSSIDVLGP